MLTLNTNENPLLYSKYSNELCHLLNLLDFEEESQKLKLAARNILEGNLKPFSELIHRINFSLLNNPNPAIGKCFFNAFPNSSLVTLFPQEAIPENIQPCATTEEEVRERIIILSQLRIGYFNAYQRDIENNQLYGKELHEYVWHLSSREFDKTISKILRNTTVSPELRSNVDSFFDGLSVGIRVLPFLGLSMQTLTIVATVAVTSKVIRTLSHPQNIDHSGDPEELVWHSLIEDDEILEYAYEKWSSGTKRFLGYPSTTVGRIRVQLEKKIYLYANFNLDALDPLSGETLYALSNILTKSIKKHQLTAEACLKILNALENTKLEPKNITLLNRFTSGCILDLKARCILEIKLKTFNTFDARKFRFPPNSFGARFWHHLQSLGEVKEKTKNKHEKLFFYAERLYFAIYMNNYKLIFDGYPDVASCKRALSIYIHPDKFGENEYREEANHLFGIYSNIFVEFSKMEQEWDATRSSPSPYQEKQLLIENSVEVL